MDYPRTDVIQWDSNFVFKHLFLFDMKTRMPVVNIDGSFRCNNILKFLNSLFKVIKNVSSPLVLKVLLEDICSIFERDLEAITFLENIFENGRFMENTDGSFCGTKVIPESLFNLL